MKTKKIAFSLLILAVLQLPIATVQAKNAESISAELPAARELSDTLKETVKKQIKQGTFFVLGLRNKLGTSNAELQKLKGNISLLEEQITGAQEAYTTLKEQRANISTLIERNNKKVAATTLLIAEYKNKVILLADEVRQAQKRLDEQRSLVQKTVTSYYLQTSILGSYQSQDNQLLAMLSYESGIGEAAQMQDYLRTMEDKSYLMIGNLLKEQNEMKSKETDLSTTNEELIRLEDALAQEKRNLLAAQESIARLMIETAGKEATYQELLESSRKEAVHVSLELDHLRENFAFFQQKLDELKVQKANGTFNPTTGLGIDDFEALTNLRGTSQFAWPVSPTLGLSAFFHDAEYQGAMGVQHNAVDIRALQGTKIHAPADGVVSKTADNGMGYSYIIVAHENGYMTLYGHVNQISVKVGDTVRQGQTIGLTGGMPGTKGAGWLTTGPHLHFEVFKNFQHVDPLLYLPLEYLPKAQLETKYIKKAIHSRLGEKIAIPL